MNGDVPKFSLVKFKTLIRDTRGPTAAVNEVLHTQDELDDYIASTQDKHKPKHAVAFPEERAVAVALGSRPHGGYHVEIIAVVQETGGFVGVQHHVLYVEQVPHGLATDMVTYPQHVIRARGLGGVVSFRQVPDWLGHSLHAFAGSVSGRAPTMMPTTMATGEEAGGEPTTMATGEEAGLMAPTTMATGEEGGGGPTTMATGEEAGLAPSTLMLGEEGSGGPTTLATGEEGGGPTTLVTGEEGGGPTTLATGEESPIPGPGPGGHFTSLFVGEEHPPTGFVGEHPTTLVFGEEGPTAHVGEHPTTLAHPGEEGPTAHIGEHPTTLAYPGEEHLTTHLFGEEGAGHGPGGGRGPFG